MKKNPFNCKILERNEEEIKIQLTCGTLTRISTRDEWIMSVFNLWAMTGSKSRYVICQRSVNTLYSRVDERIYLHRLVVQGEKGGRLKAKVDHINRDRLDNRRQNLRLCTMRQNNANIGPKNGRKYKGVYDRSKERVLKKPFVSYIGRNVSKGVKKSYLGYYATPEEAARAYDAAAKKIYGEFAYLNFPEVTS